MRSMKKYIVIGGYVQSKSDGDRYYINAIRLCELYKVNPMECYLLESKDPAYEMRQKGLPDLSVLRPSYSGDYSLTPNHPLAPGLNQSIK